MTVPVDARPLRSGDTSLPVEQRFKGEELETDLKAALKPKKIADDRSHDVFDDYYCKGCALYAHKCACVFIKMKVNPRGNH